MKGYVYDIGDPSEPDKTITVHEGIRECIVKYPKTGGYFKMKFRQKPNPIGFHARLPGDDTNG